jgi:oryzin
MAAFLKQAGLIASVLVPVLGAPTLSRREAVQDRYIVKVRPEVELSAHRQWVADVHVESLSRRQTAGVEKTFDFGSFKAYAGEFDESTIAAIRDNEDVLIVEEDVLFKAVDELVTQTDAEYNLALLSSLDGFASRDPVNDYVYDDSAGRGQFVYVVDTGVFVDHVDFGGRAIQGINIHPGEWEDVYGHGTHCAGTVASTTYGAAKLATVVDVKVLDDNGFGTIEDMLAGYDWAINNITSEGRTGQSLISMSLGWPTSQIINDAVEAAYQEGVVTVVSAGNDRQDSSTKSPASAPSAVTVGATRWDRTRSSYSNFGPGIDVFAPGDSVRSLANIQNQTTVFSGTSMSTPLVAGFIAYVRTLEGGLESPDAVIARLKDLALEGVVLGDVESPNLFVNNGNDAA